MNFLCLRARSTHNTLAEGGGNRRKPIFLDVGEEDVVLVRQPLVFSPYLPNDAMLSCTDRTFILMPAETSNSISAYED